MDGPLLLAVANYWVPSWHVFHFNGIELCPTIEEFAAIMGELEIDDLIFPTMRWGSSFLAVNCVGCP